MKKIAVIGACIAGTTTAYARARKGYSVTVFEKRRYAEMETSFANGGQPSASNAEVWNHGSTLLKGIKWMMTSNAPLLGNPTPRWHKLSWFAEFVSQMRHYEKNTIDTTRFAILSRDYLFSWAEEENIDFDLKCEDILHIYRRKAGFEHAGRVSQLLQREACRDEQLAPRRLSI